MKLEAGKGNWEKGKLQAYKKLKNCGQNQLFTQLFSVHFSTTRYFKVSKKNFFYM
jgi:hypothetical protein